MDPVGSGAIADGAWGSERCTARRGLRVVRRPASMPVAGSCRSRKAHSAGHSRSRDARPHTHAEVPAGRRHEGGVRPGEHRRAGTNRTWRHDDVVLTRHQHDRALQLPEVDVAAAHRHQAPLQLAGPDHRVEGRPHQLGLRADEGAQVVDASSWARKSRSARWEATVSGVVRKAPTDPTERNSGSGGIVGIRPSSVCTVASTGPARRDRERPRRRVFGHLLEGERRARAR